MLQVKDKTSLFIAIALIVLIAGLLIISFLSVRSDTPPVDSVGKTTNQTVEIIGSTKTSSDGIKVNVEGRPIRGSQNPIVTIIVFDDFECPFCAQHHESLIGILTEYPTEVGIITKHFPVSQRHPNARKAAEAFECALDQGEDFGFVLGDIMFANQEDLSVSVLKSHAAKLGMDSVKFNNCLDSEEKASFVESDFKEGIRLGITGTPTSYVNGQEIEGALPYSQFKQLIDSLLTKS